MMQIDKTRTNPTTQITQVKKDKFVELYRQTMGHISDSCSAVGITRNTYYNWLENDENFLKKIIEAESELNDDIRDVLVKKAGEGDMTAVIFYLKNRHPDFKEKPSYLQQINIQKDMKVEFTDAETVE